MISIAIIVYVVTARVAVAFTLCTFICVGFRVRKTVQKASMDIC